jgi:hypothetical protein
MRQLLAGAAIALFLAAVPALAQHQGGGGGGSSGGGSCAGDINSGCSQVNGTHLGSPLPVTQGGTGAASAGTAAANNIAALAEANNLSDLASASSARGNLGVAPGCGLSQSGSTLQVNATLGNNGAAITGSTYSVQGSNATHPDCGTLLLFTGTGNLTMTLAQAGTIGFGNGFSFQVQNGATVTAGSSPPIVTLNVTTSHVFPYFPTSTSASFTIPPGVTLSFQSDGTNYEAAIVSGGQYLYCEMYITGASTAQSAGSCGSVSSGVWTTPWWVDANSVFHDDMVAGGGGSGASTSSSDGGGPGAAGAECVISAANFLAPSIGYSFTVGAAGTAGSSSGGGTGGNSTLGGSAALPNGVTYTANGGTGGAENITAAVVTAGGSTSNCTSGNAALAIAGQAGNGPASVSIGGSTSYGAGGAQAGATGAAVAGTGFGAGAAGPIKEVAGGAAGAGGLHHITLTGM